MSQVTISPPAPRGGQKICGLNYTGTKKMWVEKFKSPIVTSTNRVGRIVTRTKHGWTKRQGTHHSRYLKNFRITEFLIVTAVHCIGIVGRPTR